MKPGFENTNKVNKKRKRRFGPAHPYLPRAQLPSAQEQPSPARTLTSCHPQPPDEDFSAPNSSQTRDRYGSLERFYLVPPPPIYTPQPRRSIPPKTLIFTPQGCPQSEFASRRFRRREAHRTGYSGHPGPSLLLPSFPFVRAHAFDTVSICLRSEPSPPSATDAAARTFNSDERSPANEDATLPPTTPS